MAMRQRGSGRVELLRTAGVRVFEEFKPHSEWEQDDESHFLVIYLPDFRKEQIKTSTEGRTTIRVSGKRVVAGNMWSHFLESFQIPENCEINSIQTKYEGGKLIITVPKKNVDKGTTSPSPKKPQETFSPITTSIDSALQKGQDEDLPQKRSPTGTNELIGEKNMREQKMLDDQRDKNSITPVRTANNLVLQDIGFKEDHAAVEKKKFDKDEAVGASKDKESEGKQDIRSSDGDYSAFKMGNDKKKVKALTELNEERQLLVNMGVAVLLIVALTAYVTDKFASGKAKN